MFKKIVTELLYSPAVAGSLGSYVRRLRHEKTKRQIGLIFVCLAVVVQLFATLFPPESANSSNPTVLFDGEMKSIDDYIAHYDQNTENIKDLLSSLGIDRTDIEKTTHKALPAAPNAFLWSPESNRQPDLKAYSFQTASGRPGISYHQPFNPKNSPSDAFVGSSATNGGWFAILQDSGSLVTEKPPSLRCEALTAAQEPVQVGTYKESGGCTSVLSLSLTARAISPNSPDSLEEATASDRFRYTVSVTNNSSGDIPLIPSISLEDILEYSRILDTGGGEYDFDSKTLGWPAATLAAKKSLERTFTVQVLPTIPSTARGEYITASYDCILSTTFGNTLSTPVDCPPVKVIERVTNHLPYMSKEVNLIFASALLTITTYLYLRARQLLTELYIIRHLHLGGV